MRSRRHRRRIRRLAFPQIFAEPGCSVILMDVQRAVVEALNLGESAIADVPSARLRLLVESGRLGATTDYDAANEADAAFIALPTPLSSSGSATCRSSSLRSAASRRSSARAHVIVLESTTRYVARARAPRTRGRGAISSRRRTATRTSSQADGPASSTGSTGS